MLIGSISQVVLADDYEAGKTGTITLTVQEAGDDGTVKPIPNVKLTLYKVGGVTFDGNVHFVADGALQFTGIDFENIKTAEDWYKAAESLSAAVKKYWDPAKTFGELIAQGTLSADDDNAIQEALDNLVEGATASVE